MSTKTAFVGGASKGLGFACAHALASKGYKLILCSRSEENLIAAANSIHKATRGETICFACDLSKKESLFALREHLQKRNLQVDVLINNVGGPPIGLVTETTADQWEAGLDLLFRSTFRLYEMFLPEMRVRKWGRIVNILSTTAIEPVPMLAVSSVLRSAIATYAKLVAWEVAKDGITVNSIMPGGFLTERTEILEIEAAKRQNLPQPEIRDKIVDSIPVKRMLMPEELGHFVAFLASEDAAGITGTLIPVDGGMKKSL